MLLDFAISDLHAFHIQNVTSCETLACAIYCYLLSCEHYLGDNMRYKHPFQLTSTFEDFFNWCQNCEDHISIGIGG